MQPAAYAAAGFTVNSTGDGADSNTADGICNDGAGNCTLRAAIEQANALPGTDTINFRIGTGVQTIVLGVVLPDVSDPIVIDGATQPGYAGTPLIEVRASDEGYERIPWVLHITAGGSTVRALAVGRAGILLGTEGGNDAGGNRVESCYGGLRADGVTPVTPYPSGWCIEILDSPNNVIGGTSAAARNVLSGCGAGMNIRGARSTGNLVQGNYIGPNAAGTAAVGVQGTGIQIASAPNNVIGGDTDAARNVISGNRGDGVRMAGISAAGNVVKGNYIGTNAAGTAALRNFTGGVSVLTGDNVVGGLAPSPGEPPGNLIADGLSNNGSRVIVQGNLFGLDVAGSPLFAGSGVGISCFAGDLLIGGTQPGARNVISGLSVGISVSITCTAVIQGNYIGTDLSGTAARGNSFGIRVGGRDNQIGGTAAGAGNLISGNRHGVVLRTGSSTVQGNLIGTDASGASPLPNLETGIFIDGSRDGNSDGASSSVIGGTAAGAGNRIAFNGRSGVAIGPFDSRGFFSTRNRIRGNSIFSNGLLGVDLVESAGPTFAEVDADGPAVNDAGDSDAGPNGMQNAPTVLAVQVTGGTTTVSGRLDSAPNRTYAIDLYASASCDPSGYGEGQTYLGSTQATTDASGGATFSGSFPTPPSSGQVITAASTDAAGNTSEFSVCHEAGAPGTVQLTSPLYTTNEIETVRVIVSRTLGTAGAATVDYATSDISASAGADYVPASGTLQFAPGETTKTVEVTIIYDEMDEDDEYFRLALSNPIGGIVLGTPYTSEVRIYDDDAPPRAGVKDSAVAEGDSGTTAAAFTVTLSAASARTVLVNYLTSGGTAAAGSDYTSTRGTLTFAPGETSKTVNVNVNGDTTPEMNETFNFNVLDVPNGVFIVSTGVGTILNDDAALGINDQSVVEGNSGQTAFNFTVSLLFPTVNPVSVNYATADGTAAAGSDYAAASGTLNFAANETAKTITVNVNGDTEIETSETFFVNLSAAAGATINDAQGRGTITDDDNIPTVSVGDAAAVTEGNSGVVDATFAVTLSAASEKIVTVFITTSGGTATAGLDFIFTSSMLTFNPGETSKTFNVRISPDITKEPNETFFVNLSGATNATIGDAQGEGTIIDDDGTTLHFSQAVYPAGESSHFVTITVTRTGDKTPAVGVSFATSDGTATERRDYTAASGTLQFAAGETSKTFDVLLTEDSYQEAEETINLTLSNSTGGAGLATEPRATIKIAADDAAQPQPNTIDDSVNFVRQHYHDFLNREPDAPGLAHWTNEIESCGADLQCREVKRVNVSAAFFLSIEFQETGFLAYRTDKAAYGDATSPNVAGTVPVIRLDEFLADAQRIGQGVVVGPGDAWKAQLEANKQAYALEFVQRPRFLAAFPVSMTVEEFVARLEQNAGGALDAVERAQLVASLGATPGDPQKRAAALRAVADDAGLRQAEINRAFVLMQYYGYLRRNPDDLQDTDFRGWKFWFDKLNEFDGNFVQAEMVKAFISSDEYRNRFGQ
jgi:CSLREA domain-containing protein